MHQIETSGGMTMPSERALARAIQAQVKAWMEAKQERRGTTDDGVVVVRRRRARAARHGN
jgi:hypothetical protein